MNTTWMSTRQGRSSHFIGDDGSSVCRTAHEPRGGWIEKDDAPRCSRCILAVGGAIQSTDVVFATGATYRQIDYWCRQGYINAAPRIKGATSGTPRIWPPEELRVAQEMARLVAAGLLPDAAHRAARGDGVLAPGVRVVVEDVAA